MYVCLCKGVNDRAVRRVVQAGARSVAEVGRRCGAGTCCGQCKPDIARILDEEQAHERESEQLAAK